MKPPAFNFGEPERKVAQVVEQRPLEPQVAGSTPALPAMFTELKGGLFVSTDAIALILALEDRGIVLTVRDGQLRMPVGAVLTDDEKRRGRELRLHLMALAGYVAPALG